MSAIGTKIMQARLEALMTQQELADAAKIDGQWLDDIEQARRYVRAHIVHRIGEPLGYTVSQMHAREIT